VFGPTDGQLLVSLAWRPGEGLSYPAFTATVTVDPNTEGDRPNEDFVFSDSVADDGSVTLSFTDANWSDPQLVAVQAVEDLDREGDESYPINLTVTIDIADPNFGNPTPVVVTDSVSVVDNDVPFVSALPSEIELSENDPCTCVDLNVRLSHKPTDDVYVRVYPVEWAFDEGMAYIEPSVDPEGPDPNVLTFTVTDYEAWAPATMTSGWNVEQTITVCAIDNDEVAEAWVEYIDGDIIFTPYSEDLRYQFEEEGGEAEETFVGVSVQDNDCGAQGFDPLDFNEDCAVGLIDFVLLYGQWTMCTEPYYGGVNQWGNCAPLWELFEEE
jgi:hypothetical protein